MSSSEFFCYCTQRHYNHVRYVNAVKINRVVNKDVTLKVEAETQDLTFNAKTRTKDCNFVLKDSQGPRTKAKDIISESNN